MAARPDPKKLRILKALCDHLDGVNPLIKDPETGEAYEIDLRKHISRGRAIIGADETLPHVSFLENPRQANGQEAGADKIRRTDTWSLLVQGFAVDDKANPTDPAYVLNDIVAKRLAMIVEIDDETGNPKFPDIHLLGGLILSMTIGQGVVRPPTANVSPTAFFYLPLDIKLVTDPRNP